MARQARLDVGSPEAELAARLANFRALPKAYASASALAAFGVCRTKPFIERMLAAARIDTTTWAMRAGIAAHEAVQGALLSTAEPSDQTLEGALAQGSFLFATEVPLRDDRRMLRGIADIVYAADGVPVVLELKNMGAPEVDDPVWRSRLRFDHGVQLAVYGVLARERFGRVPRLGLVHMRGSKEALLAELAEGRDAQGALQRLYESSARLDDPLAATLLVRGLLRDLRRAERQFVVPVPQHGDPGKCAVCPVRTWCPRRLDRPGEFEHVDASRLEQPPRPA